MPAKSIVFRVVCLPWVLLALVACGHSRSTSQSSGVREALAAVNIDSVCGSWCAVVVVDTLVRVAERLAVVRPTRAPIEFRLTKEDLLVLGKPGRTVIPGPRLGQEAVADTIELGAYLVLTPSPLGEDRLYGITVWPPGRSVRVLFVALNRDVGGWKVIRTGTYMEP